MTEERLRAHWFGGLQAPFWNYNPAELTMGVELEYFIARGDEKNFILANKQEYFETIRHLTSGNRYKDHKLHDQPGRISKDTRAGYVAIKPDFAWHILEISLPPRPSITQMRELVEETLGEVDAALAAAGLKRLQISCLPHPPPQVDLVELERMSAFTQSVTQKAAEGSSFDPFVDPLFPAYMVSTHVHFNAFDLSALSLWPSLFAIEAEVGEIYCRARSFSGRDVRSVRTEFMKKTMGSGYKLKGIPDPVPTSIEDYVLAMNTSTRAFPKDPFFPVRDVSYIRPSRYGTIEFRSACSAYAVDEIIEIICWRMMQLLAARKMSLGNFTAREAISIATSELVDAGIVPEGASKRILAKVDDNGGT